MSRNNFNQLWAFMSKHVFKMVSESENEDLLCVICNKIMIDTYQSECGCQYCFKCINEYIFEEIKLCPGNKDDCKEEILILDQNGQRNNMINKKISKVKVYCPNDSCEFNEELIKMEDHLRICIKQMSDCPYLRMGCNNKEVKDKMLCHLNDHNWQHTHLLIDYIENMNNEKGKNNEGFETCKREIESLKKDSLVKEKKIEDQGRMLEDVLNIIKEIKKDSIEKENKIIELTNQVDYILGELNTKDEDCETLKKEFTKYQKETMMNLSSLNEKSNKRDVQMENLFQESTKTSKCLEDIKEHSIKIKDEVETLKKECIKYEEDTQSSFNTLKKESTKIEETTKKNVNQSIEESKERVDSLTERIETLYLRTNITWGEILFRVDRFSERKTANESLFSPYFYSHFNGYKLRLIVYPGGYGGSKGTHLSLSFAICKGEYDDQLSWPFKESIKLSVVNQSTGDDHVTETFSHSSESEEFKHIFNKPIDKDNIGYGYPSIITLEDLQKVILNNVVHVRARVFTPQ